MDGRYENCYAARHHPIDFQFVFHSKPLYLGSITDDLVHFFAASLLLLVYGLLNRKPANNVGNMIAPALNLLMVCGILMHAGWT